ncbi:MAG: ComEC/Rec2 family competence protein [Lachnospiraceae bacterium]
MKSKNRVCRWLCFVLTFMILLVSGACQNQQNMNAEQKQYLTVTAFNVGEGASTLLESNGQYVLIDGGDRSHSSYVVSYLKKQGIQKIQYVIATHYDEDHIAGLVGVLNVFQVGACYGPDYTADTSIYESYRSAVKKQSLQIKYPKPGTALTFGGSKITFVGPTYYGHSNGNNDSLGMRITCGESSFLICGDMSVESELEVCRSKQKIKSDILFVNHHGSDSSTCMTFLKKVKPKVALISSSTEDNHYLHPRAVVLNRLKKRKISLFRTDKQGTIQISTDGTSYKFSEKPCNLYKAPDSNTADSNPAPVSDTTENTKVNTKADYVLNTNTKVFHRKSCTYANRISAYNRADYNGKRSTLINQGYRPCGWCHP